ncbi:39S ribosomal protein L36, mitochondrial [Holothuria leucospilota]|uniref:Ribosomal protein n=1 Tax=Holothuria leucospilota TaxID=206669 RepID=A0A9Q1CAS4_HOLLE|nr:39S ribosomal protein L36, mitochondrial [Holothuria leucospilota]
MSAFSMVRSLLRAAVPGRILPVQQFHFSPQMCLYYIAERFGARPPLMAACASLRIQPQRELKVKSAIKRRCKHCKIIKKQGLWHVICEESPRHNQRQRGKLPPPELEFFPYFFREQKGK